MKKEALSWHTLFLLIASLAALAQVNARLKLSPKAMASMSLMLMLASNAALAQMLALSALRQLNKQSIETKSPSVYAEGLNVFTL